MSKKLEIEVIASLYENVGSLLFNFYNEDEEVVGYVNIDSKGLLLWDTIDEQYSNKVLELASKINGKRLDNSIKKQMLGFTEDVNRWKRAKYLIYSLHLDVKTQTELELEQSEGIHI